VKCMVSCHRISDVGICGVLFQGSSSGVRNPSGAMCGQIWPLSMTVQCENPLALIHLASKCCVSF
jgi:hypothetical protein